MHFHGLVVQVIILHLMFELAATLLLLLMMVVVVVLLVWLLWQHIHGPCRRLLCRLGKAAIVTEAAAVAVAVASMASASRRGCGLEEWGVCGRGCWLEGRGWGGCVL